MQDILKPRICYEKEKAERFGRQLVSSNFGMKEQDILLKSKILIVGAGGLGCPTGMYLAGSGIGNISVIDDDIVSISNLPRQIGFCEDDAKMMRKKSDCLVNRMKGINSNLNIQSFPIKLTEETASEMIKNIDCVVDCVDNIDTRFLMNKYCSMNNIPLVSGSLFGWEGQITVYNYEGGPCYECIVPPNIQRNYNTIPVISPIPGIFGSLLATETIKVLLHHSNVLSGSILFYNSLTNSMRNIKTKRKPEKCRICKNKLNNTKIEEEEEEEEEERVEEKKDLPNNLHIINWIKFSEILTETIKIFDVRSKQEIEIYGFDCCISLEDIKPLSIIEYCKKNNINEFYLICKNGKQSLNIGKKLASQNTEIIINILEDGYHGYKKQIDSNFIQF